MHASRVAAVDGVGPASTWRYKAHLHCQRKVRPVLLHLALLHAAKGIVIVLLQQLP